MRRPRSALEPFSVLRAQCTAQRRSLCRPAGTQLGAHHWMDWAVRVPTMETKGRDRRAAEAMVTPCALSAPRHSSIAIIEKFDMSCVS